MFCIYASGWGCDICYSLTTRAGACAGALIAVAAETWWDCDPGVAFCYLLTIFLLSVMFGSSFGLLIGS